MAGVDLPLALTRGVVAAFNPCGFAMLPAYVTYFVGTSASGEVTSTLARLRRAALLGLATTVGFIAVFSVIGLVVEQITSRVYDVIPWATIVIGGVLAVLGVAMLFGFEPKLSLPKVGRAREGTGLSAMFLYGVSYATVSLSCTLPVFLANVSGGARAGAANAVTTYVAYAVGMGLVLVSVSLAVALAQQTFVRGMRKVLPYVNRVSGALLVVAGAYVAYYGYFSWRVTRGDEVSAGPVAWVERWSADVTRRVSELSSATLYVLSASLIAVLAALLVASRARTRTTTPKGTQP